MEIRPEVPDDIDAIRTVTTLAFQSATHSSGTEAAIIHALRVAGALSLSLVAVDGSLIVGHVAFSPVIIDGADHKWFGLGPLSVRPERQRQGIGQALVREGLARLKAAGAGGCVVVGEPDYYRRFGFECDRRQRLEGVPPEYFMQITFDGGTPPGVVRYHPGFDAK